MAGGRRDIEAGAAYVRVYLKKSEFERGLAQMRRKLETIGADFAKIGAVFSAVGGAIIGTITKAAMDFAGFGDTLDKMSIRTGISVEALSELRYAAEQSGSSLAALENGVKRMQRAIGEAAQGSATYVDAFQSLGIAVADLQRLSPERQFELVASHIAAITDPTKRAAAAMEIFGKSGTELLPLITDDMEALREEAQRLGLQMSTEGAASAAALGDAVDRMKDAATAAWYKIGQAAAPVLTDLADRIAILARDIGLFIQRHSELIDRVFRGAVIFAGFGSALGAVAAGFGIAAIAVKGFTGALWLLTAHPIVAAIAAVAAGVAGVATVIYLATRRTQELSTELSQAARRGREIEIPDVSMRQAGELERDRAKFAENLAERLHQVKLAAIEDEEKRELESLRHRHMAELVAAEKERRLAEEIASLRETQLAEEAALQKRYEDERARREKHFAEDLDADLEELRIRAAKEGLDEDLAILELEKKREIEAAKKLYEESLPAIEQERRRDLEAEAARYPGKKVLPSGRRLEELQPIIPPEVLAAIEEKYGLKGQIAKQMYKPQQADMAPTGTFSGYALAALGGGGSVQQKTLKQAERIFDALVRLLGLTEDQTRAVKEALPEFG